MYFRIITLLLTLCVTIALQAEEELDIPPGYVLEDLFSDEIEEDLPSSNARSLVPRDNHHPNPKEPNQAIATLEAGPSAAVANCVSAITGDFFDSHIDIVSCGPQSLVVQRTYSSADKSWRFQHMPLLEVGSSRGGHHIKAGYYDDHGSGLLYQARTDENATSGIHGKSLNIPNSIFSKGLTNCGSGEISGATNWKNSKILFLRKGDDKFYLLRHGSRIDRLFSRYKRLGKHHKKGASLGEFHLIEEKHPNRNTLHYTYDDEDRLIGVEARNRLDAIVESLKIDHSISRLLNHTTWSIGSKQVKYRFLDEDQLLQVWNSHGLSFSYTYNDQGLLSEKKLPDGRRLAVSYYEKGKDKGRVRTLKGPVGSDKALHVTHTFIYDDKNGKTHVIDALKNHILYEYEPTAKRLKTIQRYDANHSLCSNDQFFWANEKGDQAGNLIGRVFSDTNITHFCRRLEYDKYGNVTRDKLYGNLTGCAPPLEVNEIGIPLAKRCEVYVKTSLYSNDGWNLPLEENDGRKWTQFAYHPQTNLLKHRFTGTNNNILKREFFEYDHNGILIKEIWDDGSGTASEDLSGITERHVKVITPRTHAPIGLPKIVEEFYLNTSTGAYILLSKIVNEHDQEGHLRKEEHFGSDGRFAFAIHFEYNNLGNITKKIDALGQVTTSDYDANGNKIFEQGPSQDFHRLFTYDYSNRLIKEEEIWNNGTHLTTTHRYNYMGQKEVTTDTYGNETHFFYDGLGRLIKKRLPSVHNEIGELCQPEEVTKCDALGNAIEKWDANGHCTKTKYTIRGQPCLIEYPNGSIEKNEYTLDGLLAKKIDKNGLTTTYTYDALSRVTKTVVSDSNGNELKTTSATYNAFHMLSETDAEGIVTSYAYDGAGRRIFTAKGSHRTEYEYDALGNISKTIEHIDDSSTRVTLKKYDFLNRVDEMLVQDDAGNILLKERYSYDANGNRKEFITEAYAGKAVTTTTYTPQNKIETVIDALGHLVRYIYDFNYMHNGQSVQKITKIDPLGNQEVKIHDTHGRLSCRMHLNAFGEITQLETHHYDLAGHKLSTQETVFATKQPSKTIITEWQYDNMGNMVQCTEAKGTPEQKNTYYYFNLYGQKERIITPNGVTISHTYNALGLLKEFKTSDDSIHYTYEYDLKDRPTYIEDLVQQNSTKRTYDTDGRLSSETLANEQTLFYQYDGLDRLVKVVLPDQSTINYAYNACHLTTIERSLKDGSLYSHQYTSYDLAGNPISENLAGNAGTITRQLDLLMRSINTSAPHWQESIPADGFDQAGNLLKRNVIDEQGNVNYTYSYDDLYQLTSESGVADNSYVNDSVYNRIVKNDQPYSHNALNQLLTQTNCQYHYDRNGNLIEKIQDGLATTYEYDALDRLIKVSQGDKTVDYVYDPFHRRISKTVEGNTVYYLYEHENEIGAIEDNKIVELRLLGISHGAEIGGTVAIELEGVPYAVVNDPYGNIVALLDLDGNLVEGYRYTAFGETQVLNQGKSLNNPWRFSGKRFDGESGLVYFGRRYYASDIGRWITADPAGYADGPNLYAYVHNNPNAYIDPDGQLAWFLAALIPIAAGYVAEACMPVVAVSLAQYAGGLTVAAFLSGMVQGYNGSVLEPSALAHVDTTSYMADRAGMCVGTYLHYFSGKAGVSTALSAGKYAVNQVGGVVAQAATKQMQRCVTWYSAKRLAQTAPLATQRTAQFAENALLKGNATEIVKKAGRNRFVPDINATGTHTVFRRDFLSGKVTHYETFRPQTNLKNPNPWESLKRYDGPGSGKHWNKFLKKDIFSPHIHDMNTPGGVRSPFPWEIPN